MAVLARVTHDLDAERGPDLTTEIGVPQAWLEERATVELTLPRLLGCARCAGGGCDACQRRGAFSREECAAPERVELALPGPAQREDQTLCVRLPGLGARASRAEVPPGHLLVTLHAAAARGSERVRRLSTFEVARRHSRRALIWAALVASIILTALWLVAR